MIKQEKRAYLIVAYRRMNSEQRRNLDKTVRQLAAFPVLPGRTALPRRQQAEIKRNVK
jgi:hypothetical protein